MDVDTGASIVMVELILGGEVSEMNLGERGTRRNSKEKARFEIFRKGKE